MLRCLTLLLLLQMPALAGAAEFRVGLLHGDAEVFDYELSVLRLALAHAPGEHSLRVVPLPDATQERVFSLLDSPNAPINLFFSGYSPERERRLLQVNVPLTRGLLGYRLFLVKASRVQELSEITDIETLRRHAIGSGIGWPDNNILAVNGLKLVTSRYDNLWRMLEMERFDLFHRGVQEIYTELDRPQRSNLAVLPGVAVVFPFDYFFYVSRQRRELHDILLTGLRNAYQSGAFMAHFRSHPAIREALARAQLEERTLIPLQLPETYQSLTKIPARYWYRKKSLAQHH
ncbi:MAG: hypothetical protein R3175_17010 [Marinobacter sp.]|uniref:hypothetical protein n=1 Tax=Marinobacter sp. TaxID=50741 RepID=UPI00299DBBC8|nr:hypothetical protein [Marinobacter sp.]MDX1757759.1 hypothetical protein [Marinobacter sp.]